MKKQGGKGPQRPGTGRRDQRTGSSSSYGGGNRTGYEGGNRSRPGGGYGGWQGKPQENRDYRDNRPPARRDNPAGGGYGDRQGKPQESRDYRDNRPPARRDSPAGGGYGDRQGKPQESRDYRDNRPPARRDNPAGGGYGDRQGKPQGNRDYRDNRPPARRNDYSPRPARPARDIYAPPTAVEENAVRPDTGEKVLPENMLIGRNPIREALKAGRHFEALYVQKGELNGSAREIVRIAKEKRVQIREVDRRALENMAPGHQGLIAVVSAHQYAELDDLFARAEEKGEAPLFVILDGITDPHNMGAIARTAECCGAHGLILSERRAVGMTPGAAKASAGAFEYMPVVRVPNIVRLIEQLQKRNIWVYAANANAPASYDETDLTGPVALVIGDEGDGVSRLALERCDGAVNIPIRGKIDSLNASVAAGVLLYDVVRQRKP